MEEINKRFDEYFLESMRKRFGRIRFEGGSELLRDDLKLFLKSEINLAVSKERKQFIDGLVEREETKFQDEHPVDCIDGVTPVETYGYEATYNQAKKETISHLKEIGKQLE